MNYYNLWCTSDETSRGRLGG